MLRRRPAVAAAASQHDVVCLDRIPAAAGDALERGLECGILERLDLPAGVADEVVVMLAARVRGLEARDTVAEVDPLHETAAVERLERAVHARDPEPDAVCPNPVVDLLRRDAAVLATDVLDDRPTRCATAAARLTQPVERARDPGAVRQR